MTPSIFRLRPKRAWLHNSLRANRPLTNETALTLHKESSIECKLFAIKDLDRQSPHCLKTDHWCSGCGHWADCLETAQSASFSLPRCPLTLIAFLTAENRAHQPLVHLEKTHPNAEKTSMAALQPNSFEIYLFGLKKPPKQQHR